MRYTCFFLVAALILGVARGDGQTVDWATRNEPYETLHVEAPTTVTFSWEGTHDLHMMANMEKYDACAFTGSDPLVAEAIPSSSYELQITDADFTNDAGDVKWHYLACSVYSHCNSNQKIAIMVHKSGTFHENDPDDHDHDGHDHDDDNDDHDH